MADRAKHAFGTLENIDQALSKGLIDSYDILFVKDANGKPYVGWIDKDGNKVICESDNVDLSGIETEIADIESAMATKANAKEVDAKIDEIETALDDVANASHTHEKIKYEIADVPVGTLIDYRENEIRIMCPHDAEYHLQSVGSTGDADTYYVTFKTYVYDDNIVGYKEHLGDQVDAEILTDLKTDKYGRRYQPTWLGVAKYDKSTDTWSYYGKNSSVSKYIGWDYQIDWFNANGVIIASDSIRINLSNEKCHSSIEPYYVGGIMKEVDTKIDTKIEEKIAEVSSAYEIVEF